MVGTTLSGLAAPLDHNAPGWQMLSEHFGLESFGEPPALVVFDGAMFLAATTPVCLLFVGSHLPPPGTYGQGAWVPVPARYGERVEDTVAWAARSVGSWGASEKASRRPLSGDVDDLPPGTLMAAHAKYLLPRLPQFNIRIAVPQPASNAAAWLNALELGIVQPMLDGFVRAGGHVQWQRSGEDVQAGGLVVNEFRIRRVGGRLAQLKPNALSWQRIIQEFGDNRIDGAMRTLRPVDRWAMIDYAGLGTTTSDVRRADDSGDALIELEIGEGMAALAGEDVVERVVRAGVVSLPVQSVSVMFGRGGTPAPWVRVMPARSGVVELLRSSGLFVAVDVFDGVDGPMVWAQASEYRRVFPQTHRAAVAALFAECDLLAGKGPLQRGR